MSMLTLRVRSLDGPRRDEIDEYLDTRAGKILPDLVLQVRL